LAASYIHSPLARVDRNACIWRLPPLECHLDKLRAVLRARSSRRSLAGTVSAHLMFRLPVLSFSQHVRSGPSQLFSEFIATFDLLSVFWDVRACARTLSPLPERWRRLFSFAGSRREKLTGPLSTRAFIGAWDAETECRRCRRRAHARLPLFRGETHGRKIDVDGRKVAAKTKQYPRDYSVAA